MSPTGDKREIVQQILKLKTLEATFFPKMLNAIIILKFKKLGAKICTFES